MKKTFLSILLLIVSVSSVFAQDSNDIIVSNADKHRSGSFYSYYGIGMLNDSRSPYTAGMGITGVGVFKANAASSANPALWANAFYTMATGSFNIVNYTAEDNANKVKNTLLDAGAFQLVIPIEKNKLGVSLSLTPLTRQNYEHYSTNSLTVGTTTADYIIQSKGEGGLSRFELGVGYKIANSLSIGYAPSIIFGRNDNSLLTTFPSDFEFTDINYTYEQKNHGVGHRFGIYGFKNGILRKNDTFSFGANVELPVSLTSRRKVTATYVETVRSTTGYRSDEVENDLNVPGVSGSGDIKLPLKIELGALYQFTPALALSAEVLSQDWSKYENFTGGSESYYKNRTKYGLGLRYTPRYRKNNPNLIQRLEYRAGISYDTGYLNISGNDISTWISHFGISFPANTRGSGSTVDLSFQYGERGLTADGLVKENFWGLKLSFNLGELMFFDRKLK